MTPLLPPSSSSVRPSLFATVSATTRPIRVEPVALTKGIRRSSSIFAPTTSSRPITRFDTPSHPCFASTRSTMACTATAVSGVLSDGFHTTVSPQTKAMSAFQLHTATGKLNALITPTTPSGCHCSNIRWPGRSLCIESPYNWRDKPTAKSAMSIISCTSPFPSARILPISRVTRAPNSSFDSRRALPISRTISPRLGAGTILQRSNARWARSTIVS